MGDSGSGKEPSKGCALWGAQPRASAQDLFLASVWEMRGVIKDGIQVSDFETT